METDYISREKALQFRLPVNASREADRVTVARGVADAIAEYIKAITPADVRPVVFCRDCRFWGGRNGKNECSLITSLADPRIWLKTQPDDFCSSGERREGGADG